MKCALDQLKKKPEQIERLSPSATERLQKVVDEYFDVHWNNCQTRLQEVWIKMSCKILHDNFGMSEDDLLIYVGAWANEYRQVAFHKPEYQDKLIKASEECFPNGFPQKALDSMKTIGEDWRK